MNPRLSVDRIAAACSQRTGDDPTAIDNADAAQADVTTDGSYLPQLVNALGGRRPDGADLTDFDRAALKAVDLRLRAMGVERGRQAAEDALVQVLDILRVQRPDHRDPPPILANRPLGAQALPRRAAAAALRARRR